ncbi:MAG TPA: ATP-binding protein [Steroidobacteraceae bacterium]|nr:ATP-binding protein [Steroidobacteraceae bacterium]
MARVTDRLWFRLVLVMLVIHATLLPPLGLGILTIVERSHADAFIDQVRATSRTLADEFEIGDLLSRPDRALALLDSVILSGRGEYAEIVENGRVVLRSDLIDPRLKSFPGDDFEFHSGDDEIYYVSVPINSEGRHLVLRLGFGEAEMIETLERVRARILLALGTFTLVTVALTIRFASRLARPMAHLQNAARRIADGQVNSTLTVASSINEVRELARHLESMRRELVGANERLAGEIMQRAASEAERRSLEERLRQRERIATVGTLAGGIAHEFNNIMTPVLLYTQNALVELPPSAEIADDLRRVVAAAHRARSLVHRILTFSREIESGPPSVMRLAPVVDEVLALLRALIPSNVEIIRRGSDDAPIAGDSALVHQLVTNLCTNACQAMEARGGELTVTLSRQTVARDDRVSDGDYMVLEVRDTGVGMDEQTRSRIFEPFFTMREVGAGTGLGLSVVHGIASSMNAVITVASEPGKGTIFRTYFPVYAAAAPIGESLEAPRRSPVEANP